MNLFEKRGLEGQSLLNFAFWMQKHLFCSHLLNTQIIISCSSIWALKQVSFIVYEKKCFVFGVYGGGTLKCFSDFLVFSLNVFLTYTCSRKIKFEREQTKLLLIKNAVLYFFIRSLLLHHYIGKYFWFHLFLMNYPHR